MHFNELFRLENKKLHKKRKIYRVLAIVAGVSGGGIFALILNAAGAPDDVVLIVFMLGFFGVFPLVAMSRKTTNLINQRLMEVYAEYHGGEITKRPTRNELYTNSILGRIGEDYKMHTLIKGYFNGLEYRLYNYSLRIFYRGEDQSFTVHEIKLPERIPHIFIDSTRNYGKRLYSLPTFFRDAQKIQLEGDFYEDFTIYTSRNTHIDTLAIITPDVMEILQKYALDCNIEFVDNYMFMINATQAHTVESFDKYDLTIKTLIEELYPRLVRYKTDEDSTKPMEVNYNHGENLKIVYTNERHKKQMVWAIFMVVALSIIWWHVVLFIGSFYF